MLVQTVKRERNFDFGLISRFGRLLEEVAPDIVSWGYDWLSRDISIKDFDRHKDSTDDEINFVKRMLFRSSFTKDGVIPYADEPVIDDTKWAFAIVYDNAYGRLVSKNDDGYDVSRAFIDGVFVGWGIKFVNTEDEIDEFMTLNQRYMYNYSILGGYDLLCSQSYSFEDYLKNHTYD